MSKKLKKQLTFLDLFAISTGTMISSGFFLLPGIAASEAGPAAIAAFFLAGLLTIPALLSQSELATAMPKAGGTYYFLDRSMGPVAGTIGGLGTWFALMLKGGFGLIGFGAYAVVLLRSFGIELPMDLIMVTLCLVLILMNIMGAKGTGRLQLVMVISVLTLLAIFSGRGITQVEPSALTPFMPHGIHSLLATMGLVFISYAGLTQIASIAEETINPDRNIPLAMAVSLTIVITIYTLGVTVMVGVIPTEQLYTTLTPASDAARIVMGEIGYTLVIIAALLAFTSCANAGILSASRYPFAMARDRLLPHALRRIGRFQTPTNAILLTGGLVIFFILAFKVEEVAKLASAFQLLLFSSVNLAVIVMRESEIEDYAPGFRSPGYPYVQVTGIIAPIVIILMLGTMEILFCFGIIGGGVLWYLFYASHQVHRVGAWTRILDRMAYRENRRLDLIAELREIQKERGLKEGDPFEEMLLKAPVFEVERGETFVEFFEKVGTHFHETLGLDAEKLCQEFLLRNKIGETPSEKGVAIPHIRLEQITDFHLVLGRSKEGLELPESDEPIHAIFVLLGAKEHAAVHIRILAELATRADQDDFIPRWLSVKDQETLKLLLLAFPILDLELIEDIERQRIRD